MSNIYIFNREKRDFLDPKSDKRPTSALEQMEIYWDELTAIETAPWRSQIHPVKLKEVLPYIFLINYASENKIFFRFIGASAKLSLEKLSVHSRCKSRVYTDTQPSLKSCLTELFKDPVPRKKTYQSDALKTCQKSLFSIGLFPLLDRHARTTKAIGVIERNRAYIN